MQQQPMYPVYLFHGFLESGKSSFIKEILKDENFTEGLRALLIQCEEGIEEFESDELKKANVTLVNVEDEEELTADFISSHMKDAKADMVLIEFNAMWNFDRLYNEVIPKNCGIAQVVCTIDSTTFSNYMSNFGAIMVDQFRDADLVVFNRCTEEMDSKKLSFRGSVKAVNRGARVLFENENGEIDDSEGKLPYDINTDIVTPEDYDFGILYDDMMSNPDKYDKKKIQIKVKVYNPKQYPPKFGVMGRDAMTCCADDITPLGLICRFKENQNFNENDWFIIEARVGKQFVQQYGEELPVLYVEKLTPVEKPEDELVYFY